MTTSPSVKFTAETAPRDVKELGMIGRFRLKDLAMSIGLGDSAEARAALTSMKIEDLASVVAGQLAKIDAAGPVQVQVEPTPAELPAAAPEPTAEAPRRSPRTPKVAPPPQEPSAELAELRGLVDSLCGAVANVQKQLIQMETIHAGQLEEVKYRQAVSTTLSLFFAEEVLKAGRGDILTQVLEETPAVADELGKALKGGK
jgi:hypothetical protein